MSGFAFIVQTITFNCQSSPLTPDDPGFKPPLVGFPERSGRRVRGEGGGGELELLFIGLCVAITFVLFFSLLLLLLLLLLVVAVVVVVVMVYFFFSPSLLLLLFVCLFCFVRLNVCFFLGNTEFFD